MSLDDELLNDIIVESKEHLRAIEPDLLRLEEDAGALSDELIRTLFRAMHSVKGGFSFVGLQNITHLAHAMENALSRLRDGQIPVTPPLIDVLLQGVDRVNQLMDHAMESDSMPVDDIVGRLGPFLSDEMKGLVPAEPLPVIDPPAAQTIEPVPAPLPVSPSDLHDPEGGMALDDELLNDIIVESREHLRAIEPDLLRLEEDAGALSDELIRTLFRAM
ncbi:MAG: Hpt domain-containing protein, partial [Nitrospinae bacterium]|nr:Hpt domain-containing protein [Nitrospinota bacterium]